MLNSKEVFAMLRRLLSVGLSLFFVGLYAFGAGAGGQVINETVGLTMFPGASEVEIAEDGLDTTVRFSAEASLEEVYAFFHDELTALGWERTDLETSDDEIEATYRREGRELEFELERDNGRYVLELDVDRDNPAVGREDAGSGSARDDHDDDHDDD
ncbi:hypothetical protein [Truepera radiovictrix]|uniref:Uncharacterized protein n=1 Tax=Truepera radiovictrix (strain DSM 17093 / CIP 108686 / LMG 22925 / RQ-24) TaxID=649638 RepID=D7CVW4_TRURR|nr:hypothetical protein [Truepera radiovictrix]ADI14227.1 hypothetical protein Trad_1100 [Truepera radiovictrix DSM 17093]WMT57216.1 hypothetical protein RCV51_14505 [Truepera radiovictrix]